MLIQNTVFFCVQQFVSSRTSQEGTTTPSGGVSINKPPRRKLPELPFSVEDGAVIDVVEEQPTVVITCVAGSPYSPHKKIIT